jgi:hypothetical protein
LHREYEWSRRRLWWWWRRRWRRKRQNKTFSLFLWVIDSAGKSGYLWANHARLVNPIHQNMPRVFYFFNKYSLSQNINKIWSIKVNVFSPIFFWTWLHQISLTHFYLYFGTDEVNIKIKTFEDNNTQEISYF